MARFRYLGEKPRPGMVAAYGPTRKLRVPSNAEGLKEYVAPNQELGFVVGQDMGFEITDDRSLDVLRADTRFEEIV